MRNAVQRRNHRERAQPQERSKWGLLEKRKDYKLRAADHKVKKRKIKALQQKASERNEDEFYFAMANSQSKGGVKVAERGTENSGKMFILSYTEYRLCARCALPPHSCADARKRCRAVSMFEKQRHRIVR